MEWFWYALSSAFFESLRDLFSKQGLATIDPWVLALATPLFTLPYLLPIFWFTGLPEVAGPFWLALGGSGLLNMVGLYCYIQAIRGSDLSLTVPFITFTPLFLLVTSPWMVDDHPSPQGLVGVVLLVAGTYILNIQGRDQGWLAPWRGLLSQSGPRWMLLAALIWSFSANFDKMGVRASSPWLWSVALVGVMVLGLAPLAWWRVGRRLAQLGEHFGRLSQLGAVSALMVIGNMMAISTTMVPYAIGVKRSSVLFTVLWGAFLLKEGKVSARLAGSAVMFLGLLVITLAGSWG